MTLLILAVGAWLPGCDEELVPPDGSVADLALPEAGSPDTGKTDAGQPDLELVDASKPDSAPPDQGQPDAGGGACAKVAVGSKQALLKVIQSLIWTPYSPNAAGFVPLSKPLVVMGTVTISYKDLKPPPGCTPSLVCFQKVLLASGLSTGR